MKKVFSNLWEDDKCNNLTKKKVDMGTQRLQTFKNQMEGSNNDPPSSVAQHVNWQEWHSQQKDKEKDEEQVFEAKKNVFHSCGTRRVPPQQNHLDKVLHNLSKKPTVVPPYFWEWMELMESDSADVFDRTNYDPSEKQVFCHRFH
mmetsp:Transcript_53325/g.60397  ORF Transcript_53325/g.60397 Transcript_53325/m.60397 type:complete len:145 (-) Transcript_53325:2934-3368(-)